MEITIRQESAAEHRAVEELVREAFWNVYQPGCNEHHYLHLLRQSPAFRPETWPFSMQATVWSRSPVRSWMTTSQLEPNWAATPRAICRSRARVGSESMENPLSGRLLRPFRDSIIS